MSVFSRATRPAPPKPAPPPAPKKPARPGLRMLVPSAYRADGETDPFLRAYKEKWLSKLDFASPHQTDSLLLLAFMVLAKGRFPEAEFVVDTIIRHTKLSTASRETVKTVLSAMLLSSWLKTKRGMNGAKLADHARLVAKNINVVHRDREWLSNDAATEIDDAQKRGKLTYLADPFAGVVWWLNDAGARAKAEQVLERGLDAVRTLMTTSK